MLWTGDWRNSVYEFPDGYNVTSLCLESTYNVVSIYLKPRLKETVGMVQYWLDRVRTNDGPSDVEVVPVSFVTTEHADQLKRLIAPEDEIVDGEEAAKNEWVFELKPGDVFPVQIIASIQSTLDASKFDGMMFPVVYRGSPVFEKRFYKRSGSENVQQANMPIFNLNHPTAVSTV
jgi:hypothetical protein